MTTHGAIGKNRDANTGYSGNAFSHWMDRTGTSSGNFLFYLFLTLDSTTSACTYTHSLAARDAIARRLQVSGEIVTFSG
jgi:hypothetical protein